VALLRASSSVLGADLLVERTLADGSGVPCGDLLLAFTVAAHHDRNDLPTSRQRLQAAVGPAGLVEAALTVGVFNGLTRVADATGIVLDGGTLDATRDVRAQLGLNHFAGATNTGDVVHVAGAPRLPGAVADLFRD
jgi:hypothetical protein